MHSYLTRCGLRVTIVARDFTTPSGREIMAGTYVQDRKRLDWWFADGCYRADRKRHDLDIIDPLFTEICPNRAEQGET